ncbi:telomeric repeat-binding factor 1 isoform X3 [Ascaphus truei]|uniref:telomeric repeat-binding factor 1 isoform X3 n=1 Tax=Ascaphus truei TaxID=8439 RepID=UPI003F596FA8
MEEAAAAKGPPFDEVAKVAMDWVFDFMFVSMCHYFKEERAEDFQRASKTLEVLLDGIPRLDAHKKTTVFISQFLTRVAEGKHLDAQFETDERLTPLEAAAMVWDLIEEEEGHARNLHNEIKLLVKIQYLRMKLAMIIEKKNTYHEFLRNFSYTEMLTKIKSYIDLTLNSRPSVFLVKVATKVVEAKTESAQETPTGEIKDADLEADKRSIYFRSKEDWISVEKEDTMVNNRLIENTEGNQLENTDNSSALSEDITEQSRIFNTKDLNQNELQVTSNATELTGDTEHSMQRPQKRLFSLAQCTPWNPDKPCAINRLTSHTKLGKRIWENQKNVKTVNTEMPCSSNAPKRRQHWTWEEDALLKKGVQKYGLGNWSKILVHYDFNNRTGVMLKDRWRTMKRLNIVDTDC